MSQHFQIKETAPFLKTLHSKVKIVIMVRFLYFSLSLYLHAHRQKSTHFLQLKYLIFQITVETLQLFSFFGYSHFLYLVFFSLVVIFCYSLLSRIVWRCITLAAGSIKGNSLSLSLPLHHRSLTILIIIHSLKLNHEKKHYSKF